MAVEADVMTADSWKDTESATVKIVGGSEHKGVPILKIIHTPAMITIRKEVYPKGVVILNETVVDIDDQNPIMTHRDPTFNIQIYQEPENIVPVPISRNAGWPTGEIIMWG